MPVKWVLHWQPNQGLTVNSQILNEATQCVESLNGVKEGTWKATLNYYKPMLRDQSHLAEFPREFVRVSLHDEPSKYYYVIRPQKLIMEADSSFPLIMEKLQSYESKLAFYFEGFQYQLGDFRLRVGKVIPTHSPTVRGIIMEVEYLPISSVENSKQLMKEFMGIWHEAMSKRSLLGKFVNVVPNFGEFGLGDNYTPQHTAVLYAYFMAHVLVMIQAGRR